MLFARNIPSKFWAEAAHTTTYILNRSYTRTQPDKTPYEAWFGIKPSLACVRVFRCNAFIHVPVALRKKLSSKTHKAMFLGYSDESKAYRLWDHVLQRIVVSRDVIFHENTTTDSSSPEFRPSTRFVSPLQVDFVQPVGEMAHPAQPPIDPFPLAVPPPPPDPPAPPVSPVEIDNPAILPTRLRPRQNIRGPNLYSNRACIAQGEDDIFSQSHEPKTYHEALRSPDSASWQIAMTAEYNSLMQNNNWTLMPLPSPRTAIKCKWCFKLKCNSDGTINRFKSRLVAKGYSQRPVIDFSETYSLDSGAIRKHTCCPCDCCSRGS